ncbi:MAG: hypothetical protein KAT71_03155 [Gammaproteobacteria bacterium]|nr:hypothetical protein [Gammaproteobacteria bacterium]
MKSKQPMKLFYYDVLIDQDNICNRKQEIQKLTNAGYHNKKIVLLAPRRYGKTSLVKNVVTKRIKQKQPKKIIIFVDLMDVDSLNSISVRLEHGLSKALANTWTIDNLLKHTAFFIKNMGVQLSIDSLTGNPNIIFQRQTKDIQKNILIFLDGINALAKKHSVMLILDEFQDVAFVSEAEALFRSALQQMSESAVFILGSKRHIMERMMGDNNAPLFNFGDEMSLQPISATEWMPYFAERFAPKKISLTTEALEHLLQRMCNVPNAICEVGSWLQERYENIELTSIDIELALNDMVENKQSYTYRLHGFTAKEKIFLTTIAKSSFVKEPYSINFLSQMQIAKSTVGGMLQKFQDNGILEFELESGWRLSDPVFAHYLHCL